MYANENDDEKKKWFAIGKAQANFIQNLNIQEKFW